MAMPIRLREHIIFGRPLGIRTLTDGFGDHYATINTNDLWWAGKDLNLQTTRERFYRPSALPFAYLPKKRGKSFDLPLLFLIFYLRHPNNISKPPLMRFEYQYKLFRFLFILFTIFIYKVFYFN